MDTTRNDEFRDLVQQLMNAGWYRMGQVERPAGVSWQFRHGHTLEVGAGNDRWITAPNETEAMRILWNEVRTERGAEES